METSVKYRLSKGCFRQRDIHPHPNPLPAKERGLGENPPLPSLPPPERPARPRTNVFAVTHGELPVHQHMRHSKRPHTRVFVSCAVGNDRALDYGVEQIKFYFLAISVWPLNLNRC